MSYTYKIPGTDPNVRIYVAVIEEKRRFSFKLLKLSDPNIGPDAIRGDRCDIAINAYGVGTPQLKCNVFILEGSRFSPILDGFDLVQKAPKLTVEVQGCVVYTLVENRPNTIDLNGESAKFDFQNFVKKLIEYLASQGIEAGVIDKPRNKK